ncbi:MAG: T9SS type A sorting domain-containing protein, partial [Ignavibacteriaceae bacterium]
NGHVIKTTNAGFKQVFPEYHSIAQIQETPNGQDGKSIYNGRYVQTSGIVTSFFIEYFSSSGVNRGYFIQDGEDKWSGIFIDASSTNLAVGDQVDVLGDVWDTDYTTIRHVDSVNIVSQGNEVPQPIKLQTAEIKKEAYEGVLVQVTGICDRDSANFYEWSVNDGSGSALISKRSVKFQPVVGKTYSITGSVYESYRFDNLAILVTDFSNIVEVVLKPNSVPTINLPDTVALLSDSSISLNIWESVEDDETPDSLLNYDISSSTESLSLELNSNSGELIISAASSFIGSGYIYLQVMDDSSATASDTTIVIVNKFTDVVNSSSLIPDEYNLSQNYPNPFNPSTTIEYALKEESIVQIKVYNSIGQEVATLVNEIKPAGYYSIHYNANRLASGIYFYRIEAGSFYQIKKMTLIK